MIEPRYCKIDGVSKEPMIGAMTFISDFPTVKISKEKRALLKKIGKVQDELDKLYNYILDMK
jgi:hypothetical protein